MNFNFGGNIPEERGVNAHGGWIAGGEHVEANFFGGEVARQACGA